MALADQLRTKSQSSPSFAAEALHSSSHMHGSTADAARGSRRSRRGKEGGRRLQARRRLRPSSSTSTAIISCRTSKARNRRALAHEIFYFDQGGNLNAVRYDDWKVSFAINEGAINTAYRKTPAWPLIVNLRADPFEFCSPRFGNVCPLVRGPAVDLRADPRRGREVRRNSQGVSAGGRRIAERRSELPHSANSTGARSAQ